MKLFSKLKNLSRKTIAAGVVTAAVVGVAGVGLVTVQAQNVSINVPHKDCDSNAVMYCGSTSVNQLINKYNNGDGVNSGASIRNIYSHFGISKAEVTAMDSKATVVQAGKVTKSGDVVVDGKVVATNSITAGRGYMPGSSQQNSGGTTFYTRPPSVSFQSNSLDAFVVFKNGQFAYAILAACGNPVSAKPKAPAKPDYKLTKQVKEKAANDNYGKNVRVKAGDKVVYKINVRSTGDVAAKNITVKDNLPNKVEYIKNTLKQDGKPVANDNRFFNNGIVVDRLAPGNSTVFTFEAVVAPNEKPENCEAKSYTNVARINAPELPAQNDTADVNKQCAPQKPEYKCVSLKADAQNRLKYQFTAKANAKKGATVKSYKFIYGDGKTTTVNSKKETAIATHTYANLDAQKSYPTKVEVTFKLPNGKTVTDSGPTCKVTVKVAGKPSAECVALKLTTGPTKRDVTAQTTIATKNGARLTTISYDFDDGTKKVVNTTAPVKHTYAQAGTYMVKAAVTFTNPDGTKTNSLCQAPLTITPDECVDNPNTPENECYPCVDNPETPEDDCNPPVICEEIGKDTVCSPVEEELPEELVETGPATTVALFAAATVIGTLAHRAFALRRF